jgi:hypothetical protein
MLPSNLRKYAPILYDQSPEHFHPLPNLSSLSPQSRCDGNPGYCMNLDFHLPYLDIIQRRPNLWAKSRLLKQGTLVKTTHASVVRTQPPSTYTCTAMITRKVPRKNTCRDHCKARKQIVPGLERHRSTEPCACKYFSPVIFAARNTHSLICSKQVTRTNTLLTPKETSIRCKRHVFV